MVIIVTDILPSKFTAGTTFTQTVTTTAYPATDWSMRVLLRGPQPIDIVGGSDQNIHTLDASATETASWPAGVYWYSVRVTNADGDVVELESGKIEILPDIATIGGEYDGRSHAEKTLEAIEAVIEKRATIDQRRYRINNRELERMLPSDLMRFRDYYKDIVRKEQASKKRGQTLFGRLIRARF